MDGDGIWPFTTEYLKLQKNVITALKDLSFTEIIMDKSGIIINEGALKSGETHNPPEKATSSTNRTYVFIVN